MKIRISLNPILDMSTMTWSNEGEEWIDESTLPIRLDRAGQSEAKQAEQGAASTAANEQAGAAGAAAQLNPFYRSELNAQHLFNPSQANELLNAAEAPLAGTGASAMGEAASQAARTRNSSGFSAALDQNARQRAQQLGQAGLGIGAQDIMGAKELNQQGAAGLSGMYNTDTKAMLDAMGQQAPDINAQTDAGKSGWFQNVLAGMKALQGFKPGGGGN